MSSSKKFLNCISNHLCSHCVWEIQFMVAGEAILTVKSKKGEFPPHNIFLLIKGYKYGCVNPVSYYFNGMKREAGSGRDNWERNYMKEKTGLRRGEVK